MTESIQKESPTFKDYIYHIFEFIKSKLFANRGMYEAFYLEPKIGDIAGFPHVTLRMQPLSFNADDKIDILSNAEPHPNSHIVECDNMQDYILDKDNNIVYVLAAKLYGKKGDEDYSLVEQELIRQRRDKIMDEIAGRYMDGRVDEKFKYVGIKNKGIEKLDKKDRLSYSAAKNKNISKR